MDIIADIASSIIDALTPLQIILLMLLLAIIYALYHSFKQISIIIKERAKVNDKRNRDFYDINAKFNTYVSEHRNEHNQMNNRLAHLQNEVAEIRKDSARVRDSQISIEAKLDVLLGIGTAKRGLKNDKGI